MLSVSPEGYCKECNLTHGYCKPHCIFLVSSNFEAVFKISYEYQAEVQEQTLVPYDLVVCYFCGQKTW